MSPTNSRTSKIQENFQALSEVASSLNMASDELTDVIRVLDEALKKLNIGLNVWVTYTESDNLPHYEFHQIGYAKVSGKWGISLRRIWGNEETGDENEDGPWSFSDAPRNMRLNGVDRLPAVIEELAKAGSDTVRKVQEKTNEVRELAAAIAGSPTPPTSFVNIKPEQVNEIKEHVRKTNKFVADILAHGRSWQHAQGELRVLFPRSKSAFAKILESTSIAAGVSDAARQVLNAPSKFVVIIEGLNTVKGSK